MKARYFAIPMTTVALCMTPFSALAQAAGQPAPATARPAATEVDIRFYIGGAIGYYQVDEGGFLDADDDFTDERVAWKGLAGIEINRIFSIEGGYVDFDNTDDGVASMDADGWTVAALAAWPMTRVFAPYVKVGQLWWDSDRTLDDVFETDDGRDWFFGAGVRFTPTDRFDIRLEYERMEIDNADIDMGSLNLLFRF